MFVSPVSTFRKSYVTGSSPLSYSNILRQVINNSCECCKHFNVQTNRKMNIDPIYKVLSDQPWNFFSAHLHKTLFQLQNIALFPLDFHMMMHSKITSITSAVVQSIIKSTTSFDCMHYPGMRNALIWWKKHKFTLHSNKKGLYYNSIYGF